MKHNFAAFILTHGRANNVKTYRALRKCGYTGPIYLIVDDEDDQLGHYKKLYGAEVIVFDKKEAARHTDAGDNFTKRNAVIYARNENFRIAQELGLDYFWQLDDDYLCFGYATDNEGNYVTGPERVTTKLDQLLDACIDFLESSGATSVAFSQGGDFIGGENSRAAKMIRQGTFMRKVMNSFLFRSDSHMRFVGRSNDDVNTYTLGNLRGELLVTIPRLRLWQTETQAQSGGLTDMYLEQGTYVKSFYTVMMAPACAKIVEIGTAHKRIHHKIQWRYTAPKILSETQRKNRATPPA